ncbi:hypothetical protein [Actinomadura fibrosa]|uniref:Uncharacterized protein n=1 Tax=Actinomadura fibrosa TaxID=111802 RepID=A0ABW2XNT4_9ACTN|nr:hypothetical protein [Actinomadura fibrosa]
MSGTGFLLLGIAAFAAYVGMHWERARRALFDVRLGRQRVSNLRKQAAKERSQTSLIIVAAAVVLFLVVKYGG